MYRRVCIAMLALLPLAAQAQAPSGAPAALFELAGQPILLVDLLPFAIALFGIVGLLLIRKQIHFL